MFSKCEDDEDLEQERNLAFVAVTRAKEELVYIIEPKEEEDEDEE
jgi:ATP-dependent exoDNAse (exonuclease V) beta subunit